MTSFGSTAQLSFLLLPKPLKTDLASRLHIPPPTEATTPSGGARGGRGGSPGRGDGNAGRGAGCGASVVVVPKPGVPVQVLALAASGTPLAFVPVTIKDVTSSVEVQATPLGPSALRLESCIVPNTPPKVMFAAIPTEL